MKYNHYPTAKVKLENETVEIEPYRVAEIRDYITPLEVIQARLSSIISKIAYYTGEDNIDPANPQLDKNLSLDEIDKITELGIEVTELTAEAKLKSYSLAQLGLKRAKYKEAYNKIGKELDEFDDIGITDSQAGKITGKMMELANKEMPKVADTKKAVKNQVQKKSGRGSKGG
jgi:hypothetical protein